MESYVVYAHKSLSAISAVIGLPWCTYETDKRAIACAIEASRNVYKGVSKDATVASGLRLPDLQRR